MAETSNNNNNNQEVPLFNLKNYRLLGKSGLRVSPVCLGCMTFGESMLGSKFGANKDDSKTVFDTYVKHGGNFLDTANTYTDGDSERYIGEFIKNNRDFYVVGTKYTNSLKLGDPNAGGNARKSMFESLKQSLHNLQTDYIDLFYIHYWDYTTPAIEIMRSMDDVVRSGKVHYVAVSDVPAWKIAEMNTISSFRGWPQFVGMQLMYNLVERTAEHELIPMAQEMGLAVLPWSPLAYGLLTGKHTRESLSAGPAGDTTGVRQNMIKNISTDRKWDVVEENVKVAKEVKKSPAQVALNWLAQQPAVTSTLIGARNAAQLEDNLSAYNFTLDQKYVTQLNTISTPEPIFPYGHIKNERFRFLSTGGCSVETRGHKFAK